MESPVNCIYVLILVFKFSSSSDVGTPEASLQEHVKKLDQKLAELQSHSQAQEQKYSAVLSSVLSQLTQTTSKLKDLETSHNETFLQLEEKDDAFSELMTRHNATILELESTIVKFEEKDAQLSKLWADYNVTARELHELRSQHNNVVAELEETRSNLEDLKKRPDLIGKVEFKAKDVKSKNVFAKHPILFDQVLFDTTQSYHQKSGKFLTPMNGTYLICSEFSFQQNAYSGGFIIRTDEHIFNRAYGSITDPKATTTTISLKPLQQGEAVWVEPIEHLANDNTSFKFTIVLLNAY